MNRIKREVWTGVGEMQENETVELVSVRSNDGRRNSLLREAKDDEQSQFETISCVEADQVCRFVELILPAS